ncbi:hypothetical protein CMUS01_00975 [Colletotrichum musicola]|uniref:Uncharacterized protein n=1 Tax=Colletotrichum musicola TaxID=2175873 RepID=A0A8H6U8I8_9PEZI|nr:hypothetical protein CMUS01_00975 [Colletotrichum musicola]
MRGTMVHAQAGPTRCFRCYEAFSDPVTRAFCTTPSKFLVHRGNSQAAAAYAPENTSAKGGINPLRIQAAPVLAECCYSVVLRLTPGKVDIDSYILNGVIPGLVPTALVCQVVPVTKDAPEERSAAAELLKKRCAPIGPAMRSGRGRDALQKPKSEKHETKSSGATTCRTTDFLCPAKRCRDVSHLPAPMTRSFVPFHHSQAKRHRILCRAATCTFATLLGYRSRNQHSKTILALAFVITTSSLADGADPLIPEPTLEDTL